MLTFAVLGACFEQLEHTSSRKQLTMLLADLLGLVDADEIAEVLFLLQGRVAPLYEPVEFGLGERSIEKAVAQAFDVPQAEVRLKDAAAGDVGLVVAELAEAAGKTGAGADRSVRDVFAELRALADMSGSGSAEQKVSGLTKLLASLDPISAKHLVRIPLGTSRLGVGDATVLAALNQARLSGTKPDQLALEDAYNRTSDLGVLGHTLWTQGLEGVKSLEVMVGRPIRPQLAERLPDVPSLLDKLGGKAHVQLKFDGVRVQLHLDRSWPEGEQVRLFSRSLESMTSMFPELVQGVLDQVDAETAILDAEALAFNPLSEEFLPFQETTRRRRKHGIGELQAELPIKAMVFDMMYLNGEALLDKPSIGASPRSWPRSKGPMYCKPNRAKSWTTRRRSRRISKQRSSVASRAWSSSAWTRRTRPGLAISIGSSSKNTHAAPSRTPSTASCWVTSSAGESAPSLV